MQGCPNKGCKLAETPMTYEELIIHIMKACTEVDVECPLGCSELFPRGQWQHHRDAECPKNIRMCPECEDQIKMGHNCVRSLRGKVRNLEEAMEAMRLENRAMEQRMLAKIQEMSQKN